MKLPKLTRTRFLLIWGAGVVFFFLIGWKSIFADKTIHRPLNNPIQPKLSNDILMTQLLRNKNPGNAPEPNNVRVKPPPASILDLIQAGDVSQESNGADGRDGDVETSRLSSETNSKEDLPLGDVWNPKIKMEGDLDPDDTFHVVPQENILGDENLDNLSNDVDAQASRDELLGSQLLDVSPLNEEAKGETIRRRVPQQEPPREVLPNILLLRDVNDPDVPEDDEAQLLSEVLQDKNQNDIIKEAPESGRIDPQPPNISNRVETNKLEVPNQLPNHIFPSNSLPPENKDINDTASKTAGSEATSSLVRDGISKPLSDLLARERNVILVDARQPEQVGLPNQQAQVLPHGGPLHESRQTSLEAAKHSSVFLSQNPPISRGSNLSNILVNQLPPLNFKQDPSRYDTIIKETDIEQAQEGFLQTGLDERNHPRHPIKSERVPTASEPQKPQLTESEEEFMQRMQEVQTQRHARLQEHCLQSYNLTLLDFNENRSKILSWKRLFEHAYANDDHQFIICRVLKAGSFSWRKVINLLYDKGSQDFRRVQDKGDFPMMKYDDATFMSKLESYKKVLFIREPFARFLSAYRDKYVELRHFPYYWPIGKKIIRTYRHNPTEKEIISGKPTFEEFTRWVVTEEVPGGDFHWRSIFNWYHPCEISYDYIGKLETASEDARYIFKMIGIDKLTDYPSTDTHHEFSSSAKVLKEFYSQLPEELLPKLVERYKEEFELFDYPVPQKMSDIWSGR